MAVTLEGAYDLHVHSYPDLMDRVANDLELAAQARDAGMAGFVLKSHYAPTAERAWVVSRTAPGVQVIGSLVLNHFVGGLNPLAVEALGRVGGRVVFMPTSDAVNEAGLLEEWDYGSRGELPPYLRIKKELSDRGRLPAPIRLIDSDGELTSAALGVLDVIREYDLILATGHIGWDEMRVLIPRAFRIGVKRILVTHPESPSIDLTIEQQNYLVGHGAVIERCFAYLRGPGAFERAAESVVSTGIERNVLSSDLGASGGMYPSEGLLLFMSRMVDAGIAEGDVRRMVTDNPARLLRQEG